MASRSIDLLALNEDLLAEILILLPTLSDFGRACLVCVVFRRVITGRSFLRRLYALHPPSLLGFRTFTGKFQPVEQPHPSVAVAHALARAGDFRFSFLPNAGFWIIRDTRVGLFVLDYDEHGDGIFNKIVVCDPLTRRYLLVPPIPQDLASEILGPCCTRYEISRKCDIFLSPRGEDESSRMGELESFMLIWMAQCSKLLTFVFSFAKWQWQAIPIPNWLDLSHSRPILHGHLLWRSYAYGCFYWLWDYNKKLVVLDTSKMEFSYVSHLPFADGKELAILEVGDGRLGMFAFDYTNNRGDTIIELFSAERKNCGEDAIEWSLQNKVSLGSGLCKHRILGDVDGKLIMQRRSCSGVPEFSCFSLDFKTLQLQSIRAMLRGGCSLPFLYIGYPPSLSLPTI